MRTRCSAQAVGVARDRIGRRRGERGAALVEMVLVLPLVLILVFGIIDFSSLFNVSSTVQSGARAGGRTASAESSAASATLTQDAANAAGSALQTLPSTDPQEAWVYYVPASDTTGNPPASCSTNCVRFTWNSSTKTFGSPSGSFPAPSARNIGCNNNSTIDQVGVYVKAAHHLTAPSILPFIANPKTITAHSVFRLEPATSSECS